MSSQPAPQPTITDYPDRPGVFAIQLPDGRWHDFDRPTLAAAWSHLYTDAQRMRALLQVAAEALGRSYDVNDWPADGTGPAAEALAAIREYQTGTTV